MTRRTRLYELYGRTPTGPFSVRSVEYSRGTHRCIVRVRATSVRQAYLLAARALRSVNGGVGVVTTEGRL